MTLEHHYHGQSEIWTEGIAMTCRSGVCNGPVTRCFRVVCPVFLVAHVPNHPQLVCAGRIAGDAWPAVWRAS